MTDKAKWHLGLPPSFNGNIRKYIEAIGKETESLIVQYIKATGTSIEDIELCYGRDPTDSFTKVWVRRRGQEDSNG